MNRFFALKYNTAQKQLVPVAEICHKKSKSAAKAKRSAKAGRAISFSVLLLSAIYSTCSMAGIANGAYSYQIYRDFAENKGQFTPGARDLKIYKRDNVSGIPDIVFHQPMPDFSSVIKTGYATLVAPAYIASVSHNDFYHSVDFAGTTYKLVAINDEGDTWVPDFHAPRLNKFVVEAAPATLLPFDMYSDKGKTISDKKRFPIAFRLGSGTQKVKMIVNGKTVTRDIVGGYSYLTGGTLDTLWRGGGKFTFLTGGRNSHWEQVLDIFPQPGDSGSPLFVWDNETQQWEVVGVAHSIGVDGNWSHININFLKKVQDRDTDPQITLNGGLAQWGSDSIVQENNRWGWTGITASRQKLNDTKHLRFSGGGTLVLTQNMNQGAGGLFFDQHQHYTFKSTDTAVRPFSWQGAGLDIGKDTVVDWNIDGVRGDFLHKIGEGRLNVNVVNQGGLRLGDGIVALNTTSPAFAKIILTSGRGRLIINGNQSFNASELYFNARGGTLDLNGQNVNFQRITAIDNGARIVNNHENRAKLTIAPVTDNSVKVRDWRDKSGKPGSLYEFRRRSNITDYFIKRGRSHPYMPTNQASNGAWEYVGRNNRDEAIAIVKKRRATDHYIFHGNISGNIEINADSSRSNGAIIFDGNINVPQGTLTSKGNDLVLQGHPVNHAYNSQGVANRLKELGDDSVKTQAVSFDQPDWENRSFTLKKVILGNTQFHLARNAHLSADIQADNSTLVLGSDDLYIDSKDGEITDDDYPNRKGKSIATENKDRSFYTGSIELNNKSTLEIRENFSGSIIATNNSRVSVLSAADSFNSDNIDLTKSTLNISHSLSKNNAEQYHISRLAAADSVVTLSANNAHHLVVEQLNASNNVFNFNSAPISNYADYLEVNKAITGDNNQLLVHYSPEMMQADRPFTRASEQLIVRSHTAAADNIFTLADSKENSPYRGALAVKTSADGTDWWLISMTDNAPWLLNENRHYSSLDLHRGGKVSFAAPDASSWTAHRLTVDTLNASNVIFDLNARVRTGESDSIFITKQALGGDNQLDVHFLLASEAPLFSQDLLLASAPEATPDNYFAVNPLSNGLTLFIPNSKISSKDGKKQWLLSLTKPAGSAATQTSDDVVTTPAISETATAPVVNDTAVEPVTEPAVSDTVAAPVVSETAAAPATTPAVSDTAAAPVVNDTVVEPVTAPVVSDTAAAPVVSETAAAPATTPAVSDTAAAPVVNDTAAEPATTPAVTATVPEPAPVAAQPLITENNQPQSQPQPATALFNPFTLKLADLDRATDANYLHQLLQQAGINASPQQMQQYQQVIAHTASVVKDVEKLASLPNVAFVLETNQLNKRLGDVRQLGEDQGLWVKTSAGRASYQAMDLRHTTLQLGVDKKIDNHLFGIMGSYTRGSSQGATSSEKHTTAGAALYYSWVPDQGMFVDVIGKYLRNYQHFTFPSDAAIAEQFPRSTTLLGSVQLGYLAKFNNASNNNLFIEPSIELLAGHTSGYRMNGRDFSIQVKNSNPVYSKIGVAAGYQWQFAPQRAISVSASLYRLQNLHRGGAVELIGSGSNNRRIQQAAWDNRYLANFSVNARLSENWRIYSQLETSFAGQLKKDISGQIALRYQF